MEERGLCHLLPTARSIATKPSAVMSPPRRRGGTGTPCIAVLRMPLARESIHYPFLKRFVVMAAKGRSREGGAGARLFSLFWTPARRLGPAFDPPPQEHCRCRPSRAFRLGMVSASGSTGSWRIILPAVRTHLRFRASAVKRGVALRRARIVDALAYIKKRFGIHIFSLLKTSTTTERLRIPQ